MPEELGDYLKARRSELRLTRQRVADESGLSYAYLSQLESGRKSSPSPTVLGQLAHALRLPPEELAERAGVEPDLRSTGLSATGLSAIGLSAAGPSAAGLSATAPPRRELEWHANPRRPTPPDALASLPLSEEMAPAPASSSHRSRSSEVDRAREETLTVMEQLLDRWSPATQLALLHELQARALGNLPSR